jgi:hypothetical protein
MPAPQVTIAIAFTADDQAWVRREGVSLPDFWSQHTTAPVVGDVMRIGGRQFVVMVRVWEHEGGRPLLRLYLSSGRADSDTSFHGISA